MDASTSAARGPSAPAPGRAGRLQRSRAACMSCHQAKQRCDGPPGPCHRCVTFGIECTFPSSAGPAASRSTLGKGKASSTSSSNGGGSPTNGAPLPAQQYIPQPAAPPQNLELAEQLRAMSSRLESIESTMLALAKTVTSRPVAAPAPSGSRALSLSDHSPHPASTNAPEFRPNQSNPVEIAGEALAVEGLVDLSGANGGSQSRGEDVWGTPVHPDVMDRGIMTLQEVETEFELYFKHIHPWMALLSLSSDRDPLVIRQRCPLLFHAIIIVTLYYRPRTSANMLVYRAVSSILDSILAPIILNAQPDQLSADLIRALYLLLLYKPVQMAAMGARGVTDLAAVEHSSKLNVRASWLLRTLCVRVSAYISLPSITTTFAQAFAKQDREPVPEAIVSDQRLYFSCIWHSMHGGLQSGSRVDYIPEEALRTTRLFATMRRQPSDVRLAASVELAAIAARLLGARQEDDRVENGDMDRFSTDLDQWEEYWAPILAAQRDDPLYYTTQYPYASFVRVVVFGFPFSRWKAEKKAHGKAMQTALVHSPAPALDANDHAALAKAVKAAEEMMLALTLEGRAELFMNGRRPTWSGPTLTLDDEVVSRLRWSSDSLTCVVYSYSLIFLAKLANEGILRQDLQVVPVGGILPTSPFNPEDKLCRLLKIGADFLEALAPNPHHPAVKQAIFLRRVRDLGISGRRVATSTPNSPKLTSTAPHNHAAAQQLQHPAFNFTQNQFDPSPVHSPHVEDPFSALLDGISPGVFDNAAFLGGLDMGPIDWELEDMTSFHSTQF